MLSRQLRQWAGLMDEAMLLIDPKGLIIETSAAAALLFRRPRKELNGNSLFDFIVGPSSKTQDFFNLCTKSKQFIPGALTFRVSDQLIPCRIDGTLGTEEVGERPVLILRLRPKVHADLGFELLNREQHIQRLAQEIEMRTQAQQALAAERERFKVTLHSIGDGVVTTDQDARVTYLNPIAEALTGWSSGEASGMPLTSIFRIVNEDTRLPVENPVYRALREGVIVGLANHTILVDRQGSEKAIDDCAAPITTDAGKVLGAVLVFRDVSTKRSREHALILSHTELKSRVTERAEELEQANATLRKHQAKLVAANAELEQFAYITAHDLQEPIRMIGAYVQLINERAAQILDLRCGQYLETVLTNTRRMQNMVKSILDYSSLGRDNQQFMDVDLNAALQESLELLSTRIQESGAIIHHGELPIVMGAHSQIVRLFQNLLSNAIKFRREETPHIRIGASRENDCWKFTVSDNGIGINPEHTRRLFHLFVRLHPHSRYPGVGIGLASCKKIVELHGGTIRFDSEYGKGTTFTFTLGGNPGLV